MDAKPFGKLCPRIQAPWPGPISYTSIVSDVADLARDAISRLCKTPILNTYAPRTPNMEKFALVRLWRW